MLSAWYVLGRCISCCVVLGILVGISFVLFNYFTHTFWFCNVMVRYSFAYFCLCASSSRPLHNFLRFLRNISGGFALRIVGGMQNVLLGRLSSLFSGTLESTTVSDCEYNFFSLNLIVHLWEHVHAISAMTFLFREEKKICKRNRFFRFQCTLEQLGVIG